MIITPIIITYTFCSVRLILLQRIDPDVSATELREVNVRGTSAITAEDDFSRVFSLLELDGVSQTRLRRLNESQIVTE